MPQWRWLMILFLCMLPLGLGACDASGRRTEVPPPQSNVDQVIQGVVRDTEAVALNFLNLGSCEAFFALIAQIPEEVACAGGGSASVELIDSDCVEEPLPKAFVSFVRRSRQCTFQGMSSSGDLETTLVYENGELRGMVRAEGLVVIGIRFNFFDLVIPLDESGMAQNCSGAATAFDFPCELSASCDQCPLEE